MIHHNNNKLKKWRVPDFSTHTILQHVCMDYYNTDPVSAATILYYNGPPIFLRSTFYLWKPTVRSLSNGHFRLCYVCTVVNCSSNRFFLLFDKHNYGKQKRTCSLDYYGYWPWFNAKILEIVLIVRPSPRWQIATIEAYLKYYNPTTL